MESFAVSNEILLHRLERNDAKVIFEAIEDNRDWLAKWLPFVPYTRELKNTETFIASVIAKRDESGNEVYTIWYKGDFAGIIGFHNTDKVNEKTEIGYWLINKMQGKGIITSSAKALINIAFENMMINRITIKCANGNSASKNVAVRLGFRFEGIEREGERYNNQFLDLKVYSLLKKKFRI